MNIKAMQSLNFCEVLFKSLFKINTRNTRKRREIYSKLTTKTPERRQ